MRKRNTKKQRNRDEKTTGSDDLQIRRVLTVAGEGGSNWGKGDR